MREAEFWLLTCPECERRVLLHPSLSRAVGICRHGRKQYTMDRELLPRKEALAQFEGKHHAKNSASSSKNNTKKKADTQNAPDGASQQLTLGF